MKIIATALQMMHVATYGNYILCVEGGYLANHEKFFWHLMLLLVLILMAMVMAYALLDVRNGIAASRARINVFMFICLYF